MRLCQLNWTVFEPPLVWNDATINRNSPFAPHGNSIDRDVTDLIVIHIDDIRCIPLEFTSSVYVALRTPRVLH